MRIRNSIAVLFIAWVLVRAAAAERPPAPTGLSETLEKRLVQLDVAVEGDPAAIRAITAEDFAFYVGEHEVQGLIVDHLCPEGPTTAAVTRVEGATESLPPIPAPQAQRPRATFVFYFDQTHLTLAGREFALATARELINRLIVEGSQASIAPIAALQSESAAISKDGEIRSSGSLAREVDEPFDASASVTLASVVCRGPKVGAPITVARWVEDGSSDEFEPMTITEAADPCIQIVDVVRAGRLQPGVVDYRVVARIGDEIVATERRTLRVALNAGGE